MLLVVLLPCCCYIWPYCCYFHASGGAVAYIYIYACCCYLYYQDSKNVSCQFCMKC
jgi:hypothetical protein